MIYFVKCNDMVKIGYTKRNPEKRLAALQTANPYELLLIKTIEGTIDDEKILHAKYKKYHIRGEWFLFTGDLRTHIELDRNLLVEELQRQIDVLDKENARLRLKVEMEKTYSKGVHNRLLDVECKLNLSNNRLLKPDLTLPKVNADDPGSISVVQMLAVTNILKNAGIDINNTTDTVNAIKRLNIPGIGDFIELNELSYNNGVSIIRCVKTILDSK